MTTPLRVAGMTYFFRKEIREKFKVLPLALTYFVFLIVPIAIYLYVKPLTQTRFAGISVFLEWKNSLPIETSIFSLSSLAQLLSMTVKNYLVHFTPHLLFGDSSQLRYFQLGDIGLFYRWQSVFILLGAVAVLRNLGKPVFLVVLYWLLIAPLAAAFTVGVPFANIGRILMLLPIVELLSASGILFVYDYLVKVRRIPRRGIFVILSVVIVFTYNHFLRQYFIAMPYHYDSFWGVPYRTAAQYVLEHEKVVDQIIFTNPIYQSYMYILFYGQKDPQWLQSVPSERSTVIGYSSIDKYSFRTIDWRSDSLQPNTLLIGTSSEISWETHLLISEIRSRANAIILRIARTP